METWLNPSTNQINPVNDFKNHTDTTQASSYSSISRMELKTGIGSTLQPLSKTVSSTVAGTVLIRLLGPKFKFPAIIKFGAFFKHQTIR